MLHEMAADLSRISGAEAHASVTQAATPHKDTKVQPRAVDAIAWKGHHIPLLTPEQWSLHPDDAIPALNVAGAIHPRLAGFLSEQQAPQMGQLLACWTRATATYLHDVAQSFLDL
eukprot:gene3323-1538_t